MTDSTEWADDFSGVSPLAGPAGDSGRRRFGVRASMWLGVIAMVVCLILAAILAYLHFNPDASFGTSVPAIVLLLMAWAAAGYGWVIAFLSGKPAPGADDMRRRALWLNASMLMAVLVLTVLVAWYVIMPVVFVLILLGVIRVNS